ncbi:methylmalonyl-CoA epimerase [Novosphingobium sp. 9]|uniref:methylmalonyl-CoA epimerase n=1 Tax=Novosphingobium sp. 9 TaxID=2025349 RepID=UPI0021B6BA9F|nr:methylmalonyl-CoA epimerase [Novosphingobium sp. 9]
MKLGRINHIGVAVPDLDAAIAYYREVMGATSITEPFVLESQQVRVCFVDTPGLSGTSGTQIELLEPTSPQSPVAKWLETHPFGGQHHLCYEVPDIHEAKNWFESLGKRVLGDPRIGAHGTPIFFLHPKDMAGQLTEIMETPKAVH